MLKLIFLIMGILLVYCAGTQKTIDAPRTEQTTIPTPQVELDESFDPMSLDDFEFPVRELKLNTNSNSIKTVTPEELLQDVAKENAESKADEIDGYRVQLLATRNEEEARAMVRNAVISFNEQVYREFDNPYYKIRIGDFKSRYDAAQLQEKAFQMGFSEAWVVRSMVKKKLAEMPLGAEETSKP